MVCLYAVFVIDPLRRQQHGGDGDAWHIVINSLTSLNVFAVERGTRARRAYMRWIWLGLCGGRGFMCMRDPRMPEYMSALRYRQMSSFRA